GSISARGGSQSGNGGFVEGSGRGWVGFHGRVGTSAPKGRTRTPLLDPGDVCIYNNNSSASGEGPASGNYSGGLCLLAVNPSGSGLSKIGWGCGGLSSLLSSNNVTVTTSNGSATGTGNITIAEDLDVYNSSKLFQLIAHNNVNVNGRIWNTGQGELRIYAGWN